MLKTLAKISAGVALAAMLSTAAFAEMVWNRGNSADPESLDPHKTSTVYEAHILRDLFEGLVMQDQKADLIPGAAESWTVSDDGKVYTFKMRTGATWSDGSPVTANDFVFAWQRLVDPATGRMDTLPFFRRTIEAAGLEDVVIAVVGRSTSVAAHWGRPLGHLFIDGGHAFDVAFGDYQSWGPHLAPGGLLVFHDVFEDPADGGQAPYEVWRRAVAAGFTPVSTTGSLRVLRSG